MQLGEGDWVHFSSRMGRFYCTVSMIKIAEAVRSCPAFGVGVLLGYTLGRDTDCPKVGVFVISLSQSGAIRNITLSFHRITKSAHMQRSLQSTNTTPHTPEVPVCCTQHTALYGNIHGYS